MPSPALSSPPLPPPLPSTPHAPSPHPGGEQVVDGSGLGQRQPAARAQHPLLAVEPHDGETRQVVVVHDGENVRVPLVHPLLQRLQ